MYDCGSCFAKYLLCGFNFIVFLAGAGVLTVGVWLIIDVNSFIGLTKILPNEDIQNVFQPKLIEHAAYFIIGIGALMFVLSFLGYCGALRESQWMLTTYGLLLLIILILEIIAGSLAIVYKSRAESETKNVLLMTLDQYRVPAPESGEEMNALTSAWDSLQLGLHCCGVNNFTDYATNSYIVQQNKVMPESCCVIGDDGVVLSQTCTSNPSESNSYYMKGCFQAMANWLSTHLNIIIATATGLGAVEIFGVFLSFCLAKIFNSQKSR